MPSVFFETFGCQMNTVDSMMLANALFAKGYSEAKGAVNADLIVINTCSVREHAEIRAKARIAEYANTIRKSRYKTGLWVIGCMAQRLGETLKKDIPGIDKVIGARDFLSFINNLNGSEEISCYERSESPAHGNISVFVPVMRGCDNYCSYCIVPYVRGSEQSVPSEEIINTIKNYVKNGSMEVTLLGQNVNSYNDGKADFSGLLKKINDIDGLNRIRFTTSHPKDCSDKLIDSVASSEKICKHIHLPVQSGSDAILSSMNRKYSRYDYLHRIEYIRNRMPEADITTDVMVGFPGETDRDFKETESLFEQVRFTAAFMFAYSKRDGTKAAQMNDDVPLSVKKERLAHLISIQTEITKNHYNAMVGRTIEVLFTEIQHGRDKMWIGQDNGSKRALLACKEDVSGRILKVGVVDSSGMTLITERI
jgi:tRNA-2-methylthio-N6-dimethylallyladenosine synthase